MSLMKWLAPLELLVSTCGGGQSGVLVDIGSWPVGAVSLRVAGTLDGVPNMEALSFPTDTTRFVVYVEEGRAGQLGLTLTAFDANDCAVATGDSQVAVGSGLRQIVEDDVALSLVVPPSCAAPHIDEIAPSFGPTSGGTAMTLSGRYFFSGAKLTVAGYPAADLTVLSSSKLTATLPKHLGAFGLVPVMLQNSDGQLTSRSDLFAYGASQFSFSSQTPLNAGQNPRSVAVGDA